MTMEAYYADATAGLERILTFAGAPARAGASEGPTGRKLSLDARRGSVVRPLLRKAEALAPDARRGSVVRPLLRKAEALSLDARRGSVVTCQTVAAQG